MMRLTREQLLVAAGIILVLLVVSLWIVRPILTKRRMLAAKIEQSEKRLQELISLERLFQQMKAESGRIESNLSQRSGEFTLFAFLEGLAGRDGIKGQIEFMRPSVKQLSDKHQEEQVEMRLKGVSLERLIPYLYHIETAPEQIRVRRLTIRPQQRNPSELEVNMLVVTRKLSGTGRVMGSKEARLEITRHYALHRRAQYK
ncbi:MAG: type II secretion system protein M [Deltaproteobacteria bacterium]|nr:type II secretion system protein M [Deltaproteobacteria bacterium]